MSSSSDEEDELPPPLDDVSQELSKLGVKDASYKAKPAAKPSAQVPKKGMRRGFFDAPRRKPAAKRKEDDVVELRGPKGGGGGGGGIGSGAKGPSVPDWMRIDPNSDQAKLMQMKDKVVGAMKPAPDMMQQVMGNEALMSGFDDPEVMQAVAEIAKDPAAIKKYRGNVKVMQFYQSMAGTVAKRFEHLAEEEEKAKGAGGRGNDSRQQQGAGGTGKTKLEEKLTVVGGTGDGGAAGERPAGKDFKPLIEEL